MIRHPVFREWLLIVLLLLAGIGVAARFDWLVRLDHAAADLAMVLWARPAMPEVVIVGVDEASLAQIGRWPWRRAIQAALIEKVSAAQPAVIAYDVILSEPDRVDPASDQLLAAAIAKSGRVVVPVIPRIEDEQIFGESPPILPIRDAARSLAVIKSKTDVDGVMRTVQLYGGAGEAKYRLLGFEALVQSNAHADAVAALNIQLAAQKTIPQLPVSAATWVEDGTYRVPYAGPPGHFAVIPAINILRGDVPAMALKDKIILLGLTATGLGDEYPTPVSGGSRAMPGIEIHANVLQGIAEGIHLRASDATASAMLAALMVLVVMGGYLWLTPRASILLALAALLVLAVVTPLLFRYGMVWVSPVLAMVAVILSYPIWSWRKLEATQRYFDQELARLTSDPEVVLPLSVTPKKRVSGESRIPDVIAARIEAVTAATERLRNLKRFVSDTIEGMPTAALVANHDGRVILSNSAAERLLRPADDSASAPLSGRMLLDVLALVRPGDGTAWTTLLEQMRVATANANSIGSGEVVPMTVEAKTVSPATEYDCVVQFAPFYAHTGEATGLIVTIADITPLRESERRRDEALRFLSHDMRSPQASILTLLEMAKESPDAIPQAVLVERIGRYSRRTLNMADDFLRLAKAERARPADFQPLELTEVLMEAKDEAESIAHAKSIKVKTNFTVDEAWVSGDRDLVIRAVINLASNAVKYSPDHTTTTLSLVKVANNWRIDVADEGMGIAPENMSKLFQRFQRIHQAGQPVADGIGLGLVFVKTVIERMGGEVSVASQVIVEPGDAHGTTFSITLPAVAPVE